MLICKLPLIIFVTPPPESCVVNGQVGVRDSKYVVVSDPLPTGHLTHAQWAFWPLQWAEQYGGG